MDYKELYDKFAKESYQNSFDHGFWGEGETRSKGKMVILMISEVSECLEADRENHRSISREDWNDQMGMLVNPRPNSWKVAFEKGIKNSIEDELADVAIRIMDFNYGFGLDFNKAVPVPLLVTDDFAEGLLEIDRMIHNSFDRDAWGFALSAVCDFATKWNIDLAWHIKMKQTYNKTREKLHGKKY